MAPRLDKNKFSNGFPLCNFVSWCLPEDRLVAKNWQVAFD